MSILNGSEKAAIVRSFDSALSRLSAGEEVTFVVALAPIGKHDNSVGFMFSRGDAKSGRHYTVEQLHNTITRLFNAALDETIDAVRRVT